MPNNGQKPERLTDSWPLRAFLWTHGYQSIEAVVVGEEQQPSTTTIETYDPDLMGKLGLGSDELGRVVKVICQAEDEAACTL